MSGESNNGSHGGVINSDEAGEVVRALGTIFSNSFLYGDKHSVTVKAIKDSFAILQVVFGRGVDLAFSIADEELIVNSMTLELKNPLMKTFASRLKDLEVSSFTISSGLKWDDFQKLVVVFNMKGADIAAQGGFPAVVAAQGISGITTKSVIYKAVTEDEVVVNKDDLDEAQKGLSERQSDSVVAFLNGDTGVSGDEASNALKEVADDPQKLSELVLKAAEARKDGSGLENGESFSSAVVGCLRKAYDVLASDKSAKTQKGKKNLQKMLMLLEKEIMDKLRAVAGGADIDDGELVDAIEEMEDELKIDSLASDYMKKRNAIEANESRIIRFIKAKGADRIDATDLKDRLFEGGLDTDGWSELLMKSGIGKAGEGAGAGPGGGLAAMGHLAVLLHEMEQSLADDKAAGGVKGLDKVAKDVRREIEGLVAKTERKILDLVDSMQKENEAEARGLALPQESKMPRRKLMELLAEIGQELCQPLAVINCSVDMLRSGTMGDVTSAQLEMLCLTAESGSRLQVLINKLMKISGVPDTRSPDAGIQQSLYK